MDSIYYDIQTEHSPGSFILGPLVTLMSSCFLLRLREFRTNKDKYRLAMLLLVD